MYRSDLEAYAQKAFQVIEPSTPLEYNWHIGCLCEHLQASFNGELPKLIINIAPRFLKSVIVAQIYPSWVLGKEPHHQFIGASYAHSLAEKNVMKCRQIINSEFHKSLFDTHISTDQNQKDYFTTTQNGQYKGTGIGGTITGFGCNTLLVDDPINPLEGLSETVRSKANDEIRSTLFSRYNDSRTGRFIMIMQRLHEDDPTGNLLADGGYHHLKIPAEAPSHVHITLGNKEWEMDQGELLDPVRTSKEILDEKRTQLGEYNYAGQYLQEPVPMGGGELQSKWLNYYQQGGVKPSQMNIYILVDAAGGDEDIKKRKKKMSDYTAMVVVGLAPDNNYYLLDILRDRLNPTERIDMLFMLHRKWSGLAGKPPKVGYEKYGIMTDTHYLKEKQRQEAYNFPIVELGGRMAKNDRIRRLIPDMQIGRWWFPTRLDYVDCEDRKFDLVQEIINSEMQSFPRSKFDDMIDALSRIYEDELMTVFPTIRKNESSAMRQQNTSSTSWVDW